MIRVSPRFAAALEAGDMTDPFPEAIPAATLVIFRDRAGGAPELLMVERAEAMAFAGGAMVFPGGRIDPGDRALAATLGGASADDAEDLSARVAAVRETIEEAGLPIGLDPLPGVGALADLRRALHAGEPFGEALTAAGATLTLDTLDTLVPFARWRPAHRHARIFDTRFYITRSPPDTLAASVDATENVRLVWATAQRVLDDADAGSLRIIFPTRRNLERLAQFASFAEAAANARAPPSRASPSGSDARDGAPHLCIPDELGYPVTAELLTNATRG